MVTAVPDVACPGKESDRGQAPAPGATTPYTLRELVGYALKLGTFGFGGPVALVAFMHRDLVERRNWISEAEYREGLALAQLMPGPLAAQLAMYLGYVHHRVAGATLVGVAFVLPSFLMVLALGWAYVRYGGIGWMQAVFYGVGACVIGIIALGAQKLLKKTLGRDLLLWAVGAATAAVTIMTESEIASLFLLAGLLVLVVKAPPRFLRRGAATPSLVLPLLSLGGGGGAPTASPETLWQIALFFAKAGAFVFGSGLAIIPFLYGGVVKEYGWLDDRQFVDAVAVAMITPGPVVITVGFIGYLVGGFPGACVAALATFLPCYLFTVIPAPYFQRFGKRPGVIAFVEGVTAAAVGAIAGAVVVLGRRTLLEAGWQPDWIKVGLAVSTFLLLWRFRKIPEPVVVLAAAVVGLVVYPLARQ